MLTFLSNLDQTIFFFVQKNFHFPILDKIMILATVTGNKGLIWILISLWLFIHKKTRHIGIITLLALTLSVIMGEGLLKHIVQRPRPYADFSLAHLLVDKSTTYSFPSGHTATSFAAAYALSKYIKKFSLVIWTIAITIAFSRLYLFLHYPSDIVAGVVLGLICGKAASYLYESKINDKLLNKTREKIKIRGINMMSKNRLEAFSDGVLAIIITIMVLELQVPRGQSLNELLTLLPVFLSYVLSFVYIGIYWNNHHHLLHAVNKVSGSIMWANLHFLFWLSLLPFATGWMGQNPFAVIPSAFYGWVLLMTAIAYHLLQWVIMSSERENSALKYFIGSDWKGKGSVVIYFLGTLIALKWPGIAQILYVLIAIIWLQPDRRIEKAMAMRENNEKDTLK